MALSKSEVRRLGMFGVMLAGLGGGAYFLLEEQVKKLAALKVEEGGSMEQDQIRTALETRNKVIKLKKSLARSDALLKRVEATLGRTEAGVLAYEDVTQALPAEAKLIRQDRAAPRDLAWEVPLAEGEEPTEGEPPKAVKYREQEYSFSLRLTYKTWVEFLAALEHHKKFFALKQLSLRPAQKSGDSRGAPFLLVDMKMGVYHVLEFPSESAPKEP